MKNADVHVPRILTVSHDRYEVQLDFYHLAESNGDIDNRCKCVLDCIKGKAIYDDWNVKRLVATIHENSDRTGVAVRIMRYGDAHRAGVPR